MWNPDQRNVDFVTDDNHGPISWLFDARQDAPSGATIREEQLEMLARVWELFEGLVVPITVKYNVGTVDTSATGGALRESYSSIETNTLHNEEGVNTAALSAVLDEVETAAHTSPAFLTVETVETKTKVRLAEGDHWITPDAEPYICWSRGEPSDATPRPLLDFTFLYMMPNYALDSGTGDSPPVYWLRIESTSDIWIATTAESKRNRERLRHVIEGVQGMPMVINTKVTTEQLLTGPQISYLEQISSTELGP